MTTNTEVITELVAVCVQEPVSEQFQKEYRRAGSYRCQFVEGNSPRYYRIFPEAGSDQYECAVPRTFTKFFHIEEKSS